MYANIRVYTRYIGVYVSLHPHASTNAESYQRVPVRKLRVLFMMHLVTRSLVRLFLSLLLRLVCKPPPPPPPSFPPPPPPLPTPPLSTVLRKLSLTLVDRVHGAHRSDGSSGLLERNSPTITERTARGTGARNAIGRTDSSTRPSSPLIVTNTSDNGSEN